MKNMIKLPAIILGLMLLLTGTSQKVMAQGEDVSMQSFYDELSPYGTWIQDPQYGYVWRPDVEQSDFRPYYSNGRWAMTEYGNTWVSNYDWGWAPFHYGRWVYNRYNEWVWIPDTTWGPAWVSWRTGGGYYGWAPMGPGMNININFNIPDLWWVFIPQRNIYYNSFPRYYARRNVTIIHNTTVINNTYVNNRRTYYTGPRADDIRRVTRQNVTVYKMNNTGRPSRSNISGNNINIYTPRPSRGSTNVNAAPRQAIKGEGYTTIRSGRPSTSNGTTTRPSRGNTTPGNVNPTRDNRTGITTGTGAGRPAVNNNSRPTRAESNGNPGTARPQMIERAVPATQITPTTETPVQRPQVQPTPAERPAQRVQPPAPQPRPQQPPVSRPAPQPQMQRPQRVQPSVQPSRSSESRGSQGEGRTESSRPSRGGG